MHGGFAKSLLVLSLGNLSQMHARRWRCRSLVICIKFRWISQKH